jgi:mannosyltransferase OCH1-like enzyme
VDQWHSLLPDWEIRAWSNENVDFQSPYLRQAYAVRAWNRVSDYARMDALARFGGVYLDTDVDLVRSLEPLRDRCCFLGFQAGDEAPGALVNGAVFGAVAGHWLPTALRKYLNEELDGRTNTGAFSGPGLITRTLRKHGLKSYSDEVVLVKDVTIFPKRYFYPYSWKERYSEDVIGPDTFAVHRWAESWAVRRSFRWRLRRGLLSMFAWTALPLALSVSRVAARRASGKPLGTN